MQNERGENEFKIPSQNFPKLSEKIEKLTRRARKLGKMVPELTIVREIEEKTKDNHGREVFNRFHVVEITSEPVYVNGWEFVGCVQIGDSEVGLIVNQVPGAFGPEESIPEKYRTTTNNCDHCKTLRYRNDVFILRNEQSEFIQVGRNCLGQFLGGIDPKDVVAQAELAIGFASLVQGAIDPSFFGGSAGTYTSLRSLLEVTYACIQVNGWVSKKVAMEKELTPTISHIQEYMYSPANLFSTKTRKIDEYTITEADEEYIQNVMDWAKNVGKEEQSSDYLHNLSVLFSRESIEPRHFALAASVFTAFRFAHKNEQEKAIAGENTATKKRSEHIGTKGERSTFLLTLVFQTSWTTNYGITYLYSFEDAFGNKVVWKASNNADLNVGEAYEVLATIKDHTEYKGEAQTQITRSKVIKT